MRRRLLAVLGFLCMVVVAVGCGQASSGGQTSSNSDTGSISVFTPKNTTHAEGQAKFWTTLTTEFQKAHPGAHVDVQYYSTPGQELTKIEAEAAGHAGPDVIDLGSTVLPTAYATKAFQVLSPQDWSKVGGRNQFATGLVGMAGPSADKDIGIPAYTGSYLFLYNRTMFKSAGIEGPPTTWNQFVDDARKLTDPSRGVWGVAMDPSDPYEPWHELWLQAGQRGGALMNKPTTAGQFTSQPVVEGAEFWLNLITTFHVAPRQDATYQAADAISQFLNGHAAMLGMEVNSGIITQLASSPVANDYGLAQFPTVPYGMSARPSGAKPLQGVVFGYYPSISKYSQHKSLDLDFIKFRLDPKMQFEDWKDEGNMPAVLSTYQQHPELKQGPWGQFYQQLSRMSVTPFSGSWGQLETLIAQPINKMAGEIATTGTYSNDDLKASLAQANQQLNASIQQQGTTGR